MKLFYIKANAGRQSPNHAGFICSTLFFVLSVLFISCTPDQHALEPDLENRESILDRKVFIEPELLTDIPQIPRFCDQIELTKHRIKVGDTELYVEEEGRGTPLVLINGGPGGTHHYFHPWFSRAKKYARVIYYDQRGCGRSDFNPGKEGYSVDQAISDLDAIRKALDIDKWVVLGYSYGGFLAQYYTLHYPEHTAGMILLGAFPNVREDTGPSRQRDFLSEEEQKRLREIRQQLIEFDKKKDLSRKEYIQILIYNNFLNGDWKRQQFYRPSLKRIAQNALVEWDKAQKSSPDYIIESTGWGRNSNKKLVQAYSREWLEEFDVSRQLLKIGFALYDFEMYEDALLAFEKMEAIAEREEDKQYMSIAIIWQGHMLDLMEKRVDSISRYKKVVAMNLDFSPQHAQYGMRYTVTPYAQERINFPFKRIENRQVD